MPPSPKSAIQRRRHLARALSRVADASVSDVLAASNDGADDVAWRIGVSGPPGAGKSTLIARLANLRLERLADKPSRPDAAGRLAVLAVDPSSKAGGGAILGDRIRMDTIAADNRVFIRSFGSRGGLDGVSQNIIDLLTITDANGFDEIILETVGVGQSETASQRLVDTFVVVLHPNAGDSVQAMKSGIMESADVFVVNKADLPGAKQTVAELKAVLKVSHAQKSWKPPVVEVSRDAREGIDELDGAIERHRDFVTIQKDRGALRRDRRTYQLQSLLIRRVGELIEQKPEIADIETVGGRFDALTRALAGCAGRGKA